MISVVRAHWEEVTTEGILRSTRSNLDADTAFSRELEIRAGSSVSDRLQAMGELPVGAAVITPGGDLHAPFIIHVVLRSAEGRVTPGGLRSALQNGLRRADEWGLESLALPPLGTGAGNLDAEESAGIMIPVISHHLQASNDPREVLIVVGTEYEREVFSRAVAPTRDHVSARGS